MSLVVSSSSLTVRVDPDTGRIIGVRNLARDLELIDTPQVVPPFRLELKETGWTETWTSFRHETVGEGVRLIWETEHAITLIGEITARGDDILFNVRAENNGAATIDQIEYPIFAGIGRLSGAGQDEFVSSHGTGMLFRDPLDLFEDDPTNRRRLRYSIYPEGFAGSTMQLLAYYGRGRGGFYFGTEDTGTQHKGYNFFKEGDLLGCTLMHKAPVVAAGAGFAPGYPVVLGSLTQGSWYEVAERYKRWALRQEWAQPKPRSRWLREQVGINTFGINAQFDRGPWFDRFHEMAGVPIFHILGPNWVRRTQDYRNDLPRGREDWFPARFSAENLAAIRRNGDFWAPFEFDLLCNHSPDVADPVLETRVVPRPHDSNSDAHRFSYMCAGTDYWHDLHVWRDEKLVTDYNCDAHYYDISVSNMPMECIATNHKHQPGAGQPIIDAYRQMYSDTNAASSRAKGEIVPTGTEVISECFVQEFDFYQARAEASPYAPFEVDIYRDWILAGRAEKIPLFTYVYHENGPVRLDGWSKLSREAGDLFYWVAARVLLNGGLLQLNYEFSPLEALDGRSEDPAEHYYGFEPRLYEVDPAKAAFVGEVARTRVGAANPFLAYGTMLPAPVVEAPTVELDYFRNNVFLGPTYEERGSMAVPSVLATAWQHEGRTAWVVANLLANEQTVRVDGKPLTLAGRKIVLVEQ